MPAGPGALTLMTRKNLISYAGPVLRGGKRGGRPGPPVPRGPQLDMYISTWVREEFCGNAIRDRFRAFLPYVQFSTSASGRGNEAHPPTSGLEIGPL